MLLFKIAGAGTKKITALAVIFFLFAQQLAAQDSVRYSPRKTIRNFLNPDSVPLINFKVVPIPLLTSAPETGLRVGGALEYFFNAKKKGEQSEARGSNIYGQMSISAKGQFEVKGSWQVFTKGEHFVFRGGAGYTTNTDRYWGVGNAGLAEKNYYTQNYSRLFLESRTYRLLKNQWYAGLKLDYSDSYNLSSDKPLDSVNARVSGINGSKVFGLGPALLYEGRDYPFSAHNGAFAEIYFSHYMPVSGDSYKYDTWFIDLRKYYPISKENTLAFQFMSLNSSGNVPLREMPRIGGASLMRGYFTGRFRDNSYTAGQAEIRFQIWRWLYGASFAAAGIMDQSINQYQFSNIRYAGGLGLRFLVNKKNRMFLRADCALNGTSGAAYYIRLNEAF